MKFIAKHFCNAPYTETGMLISDIVDLCCALKIDIESVLNDLDGQFSMQLLPLDDVEVMFDCQPEKIDYLSADERTRLQIPAEDVFRNADVTLAVKKLGYFGVQIDYKVIDAHVTGKPWAEHKKESTSKDLFYGKNESAEQLNLTKITALTDASYDAVKKAAINTIGLCHIHKQSHEVRIDCNPNELDRTGFDHADSIQVAFEEAFESWCQFVYSFHHLKDVDDYYYLIRVVLELNKTIWWLDKENIDCILSGFEPCYQNVY